MDHFAGETKQDLVTVIVPIYQVYPYLRECVDSLLNQTYPVMEIILVDDGSTDGSECLCDGYAVQDQRIRVIHQRNQGLSAARNAGLQIAKGKFIAFVDADDAVMPDYIAYLYEMLVIHQADIAVCQYTRTLPYTARRICKEKVLSSSRALRGWHGRYKRWETVVWNKLYRRAVLEGGVGKERVRFPVGKSHEDVWTSHLFVHNANRIVLTDRVLYYYRPRIDSLTGSMAGLDDEQEMEAQISRMHFFGKRHYYAAYLRLAAVFVIRQLWRTVYKKRSWSV